MEHIFICYSRQDKKFAFSLNDMLENAGKEVWIDTDDLAASSIWRNEVEEAITQSIAFVYLITPNSLESEYCKKEFESANHQNKRIFPILLPGTIDKSVPEIISSRQWLYWQNIENENGFTKLLADIETDHEWLKYHTKLQAKALDWERRKDSSRLLRGKELQEVAHQLATSGSKDPQPTDLQRQYALASQKDKGRKQTQITIGSTVIALMMIVLTIFAVIQQRYALARQLVAQAQSINATRNSNQTIAVLLATRSMQITPSSEASQVLLNNLNAHTILNFNQDGEVHAVAFSKDGKLVASNSGSNITITETATGREISHMAHNDLVYAIVFSPDGKFVISGGRDRTVRIWDTLTGEEIHQFALDGTVSSLDISHDGQYIVAGGFTTISVWKTDTGTEISRMKINAGPVYYVFFSKSGNFIGSVDEKTVRVWETKTSKEVFRKKYSGEFHSIDLSSDEKYVVSVCDDFDACVWDVETKAEVARMTHNGSVTSVDFSPNGEFVVSGSRDNTARV